MLVSNTVASYNTAAGSQALSRNIDGNDNAANGYQALYNNSCFIGNIRGVTTAHDDAIPILIDSNSQLGTLSSSRQFKNDIKPMHNASEAVLALRPVTFHYKRGNPNAASL